MKPAFSTSLHVAAAVSFALALAPAGDSAAAPTAAALQLRRGTFAYDHRNVPVVSRFAGFEFVVLSARATALGAKVDSVHAWGGKVLALVQPTLAAWDRTPWENARWDAALWDAARRTGGVLRDAKGDTAWLFQYGMERLQPRS